MCSALVHVCFGPKPDSCTAQIADPVRRNFAAAPASRKCLAERCGVPIALHSDYQALYVYFQHMAFASCPALVRTVVVQCAAMQLPLGNAASTLISTSDASAIPEAKSPANVSLPLRTGVPTGSSISPSSANTKARREGSRAAIALK